jgi:hypothetical protein
MPRLSLEIPTFRSKTPGRAGQMQLANAAPGHYALQVVVTDKLAKENYRIAVQSMDFEIRE